MSPEPQVLVISGVTVQVVRKNIKNLHLRVYPPDGRVRMSVPLRLSDDAVRQAAISKLAWIKKQQARFAAQDRQSGRELVSGESHTYLGREYRLQVVERAGASQVALHNPGILELQVRPGTDRDGRARVLQRWYRERLRELVPPILARWEGVLGVHAASWGIRRMRTRWGSCNVRARRIWLNLELARRPVECLETIIVHELMHLLEPHHNARFRALMDRHLPEWRRVREELKQAPFWHADWAS